LIFDKASWAGLNQTCRGSFLLQDDRARQERSMSNLVLRLGATALALFLLASPGQAVTCEEARSLSATELSYWAQRLEVSPPYLAALLVKAFCEVGSGPERIIITDEKRPGTKAPRRASRPF
jgi:hypothetical protein